MRHIHILTTLSVSVKGNKQTKKKEMRWIYLAGNLGSAGISCHRAVVQRRRFSDYMFH